MQYIEKIKIVDQTYPGSHALKKGFEFDCDSVNLFVGEQGCGKSTLLNLIQKNHKDVKLHFSDYTIKNKVDSFFFDSEKDNPRVKNPELYTKPNGEDVGIGFGSAIASRFKSHGEILEAMVIAPLLNAKNCVILLDEPESSLSLTNQFKLIRAIKEAVKNNCQFFIATHCYLLIKEFNVISLEHKKQMSGLTFIDKIKKKHAVVS